VRATIWGSAFADTPNEFFVRLSAGEKLICEERSLKMIGKIAIFVLCFAYGGAQAGGGGLVATGGARAGYLAQTSGAPARTGQPAPDSASPLPQGKTRVEPVKEEKPAAPAKGDPLKSFEPTEKVRADQALDFPADI
jgi:hypothetical protein